MIGKIIPDALWYEQNPSYRWKSETETGFADALWYKLTDINLAPIHIRLGEGKGSSNRPTPYIATAKKWQTRLSGRGFKPESKDTGPLENTPPRLR